MAYMSLSRMDVDWCCAFHSHSSLSVYVSRAARCQKVIVILPLREGASDLWRRQQRVSVRGNITDI